MNFKFHEVNHLRSIKRYIVNFIEWLYVPFHRFIPMETFRYAVCGGSNTFLDIFLYFVFYNFILQKKILHLFFISISPYIAAYLIVFPITFTTGFLLSKYITFTQSNLHGKVQLFRYGVTVVVCILLNYIFIKFFVEVCHIFPTISKTITTGLVVIYSYFSQKYFTFKVNVPACRAKLEHVNINNQDIRKTGHF